ncbi:hypothetical protein K1719_022797 [Acacia pycnantha]|nr:hypothetical protein K1719_022797 [Acacia pycnantha]
MLIAYDSREIYTLVPQELVQNLNIDTLSAGKTHPHHHRHQEELNVVASSSTSDEADEKKQRRTMSNRESARRSRMKKKRHIEELTWLVMRLRKEKHDLIQRLKHVIDSHDRVLEKNAKLKEEASHLRQMLETSVAIAFVDFDEPH